MINQVPRGADEGIVLNATLSMVQSRLLSHPATQMPGTLRASPEDARQPCPAAVSVVFCDRELNSQRTFLRRPLVSFSRGAVGTTYLRPFPVCRARGESGKD